MKTIEEKTAGTVLQETQKFRIGGRNYEVKPASLGTLIQVSRLISKLPDMDFGDNADVLSKTMTIAKDCDVLGDIAATLILGVRLEDKQSLLFRLKKLFGQTQEDKIRRLAYDVLNEDIARVYSFVLACFSKMEVGIFFGLTTSLQETNILRKTRGVVKTTVSGR